MSRFKEGDICVPIPGHEKDCPAFRFNINKNATFVRINNVTSNGNYDYEILNSEMQAVDSCNTCFNDENIKLYSESISCTNSTSPMKDFITDFIELFKTEPQKSFNRVGLTDDLGNITNQGLTVFGTWLLKQNADKFKAEVVDPIIAAQDAKLK